MDETIVSYDQIAPEYLARWHDRSLMESTMRRFVQLIPSGGHVLDVGCGPGFDAALLREHDLSVTGLDRSLGMLQLGKVHFSGPFVQADMRCLPFRSGFDGLWANASLLHLPSEDVPTTLRVFHRVLRQDGILFLSVKQGHGAEWIETDYHAGGRRFFTFWQPETLEGELMAAGFEIIEATRTETIGHKPWLVRLARKLG